MSLADWLKKEDVTLEAFGERIGKSAPTVSRIVRGIGNTDLATIRQIEKETNGEVTAADILRASEETAA